MKHTSYCGQSVNKDIMFRLRLFSPSIHGSHPVDRIVFEYPRRGRVENIEDLDGLSLLEIYRVSQND